MSLTGFVSTSFDRLAAEEFTWSNPNTGHESTLFKIMWKSKLAYYVMDMSALPQEKEILLNDGVKFEVISVEKTVDQYGSPINLITLKHEWYDGMFKESLEEKQKGGELAKRLFR